PRMTQGTATELQQGVVRDDGHQCRLVPDVDAAAGDRHDVGHVAPVLIDDGAAASIFLVVLVVHDVYPAQGGLAVAFQLAHHGAGVQVVTTGQTQHLGQHAEVDAVTRIAVEHGVHGTVDVQQHAVVAAPVGQAGVGGEAAGQVVV